MFTAVSRVCLDSRLDLQRICNGRCVGIRMLVHGGRKTASDNSSWPQASGPAWLYMDATGRRAWTHAAVHAAVARIAGNSVGDEEPLLQAGVDSLGAPLSPCCNTPV